MRAAPLPVVWHSQLHRQFDRTHSSIGEVRSNPPQSIEANRSSSAVGYGNNSESGWVGITILLKVPSTDDEAGNWIQSLRLIAGCCYASVCFQANTWLTIHVCWLLGGMAAFRHRKVRTKSCSSGVRCSGFAVSFWKQGFKDMKSR